MERGCPEEPARSGGQPSAPGRREESRERPPEGADGCGGAAEPQAPPGKLKKTALRLFGGKRSICTLPSFFGGRSKGQGKAASKKGLGKCRTHEGLSGGGSEQGDGAPLESPWEGSGESPPCPLPSSRSAPSAVDAGSESGRRDGSPPMEGCEKKAGGEKSSLPRAKKGLKGFLNSIRRHRKSKAAESEPAELPEWSGAAEEAGKDAGAGAESRGAAGGRGPGPVPAAVPAPGGLGGEGSAATATPCREAAQPGRPAASDGGSEGDAAAMPGEREGAGTKSEAEAVTCAELDPEQLLLAFHPDLVDTDPPCLHTGELLSLLLGDVTSLKSFDSLTGCGDDIAEPEVAESSLSVERGRDAGKRSSCLVSYQGGGEEMAEAEEAEEFLPQVWEGSGDGGYGAQVSSSSLETQDGRPYVGDALEGVELLTPQSEQQESAPNSDEGYYDSTTPGPEEEGGEGLGELKKERLPRDSYSGDALYEFDALLSPSLGEESLFEGKVSRPGIFSYFLDFCLPAERSLVRVLGEKRGLMETEEERLAAIQKELLYWELQREPLPRRRDLPGREKCPRDKPCLECQGRGAGSGGKQASRLGSPPAGSPGPRRGVNGGVSAARGEKAEWGDLAGPVCPESRPDGHQAQGGGLLPPGKSLAGPASEAQGGLPGGSVPGGAAPGRAGLFSGYGLPERGGGDDEPPVGGEAEPEQAVSFSQALVEFAGSGTLFSSLSESLGSSGSGSSFTQNLPALPTMAPAGGGASFSRGRRVAWQRETPHCRKALPSSCSGLRAAAMAEPRLLEMLDLAIGTPEPGAINFRVLHSLLRTMLEGLAQLGWEQAAQTPPGLEQEGDRAQGPGEQLSGTDPLAGTASGGARLASVATDVGEMKEKVKENESGISKALDEIGDMKAAQSRMGEDIQAMQEALGLLQDRLQEAAGRLPGPRDRRVMDMDEESSGSQSPSSESPQEDTDIQRGGRSALGPEGAGGQAVPTAGEGTLGTQPGSLGMQAGRQGAAATAEKGAGAPTAGRRGSSDASPTTPGMRPGSPGIQTHIPGMQPGSPGIQTHIPGMHTGSPGIETYAPGMQPGSPGIQTHIPGMHTGSPGIQTHIPGMHTGSPGIQTHIPGMQPGSPGIQTHIPGMQPGSPGIQTHIPGMQPGSPGIQTHIPGMQPGSPGIQTHIPGMQPGSPGIQTHIPGMQPGSPGIQTHIPGMQPGSPGIQTHIPGMQPGSPGIQTHIPGMQPGSPGIQTHIPGMQPGSPGIQTHIPGMQPGSPGIQTHIPGMQPGSPGIQTHIPGMQPGSPGIQTHIPGMQPGSPGIQTHIPGMQPGSPGIQTHIPGMQPGSPGIQTHIPGMQPGSPGIQTHIPGMQPGSPGIQTHIPGMQPGSPGIQTHIPGMQPGSPGIQTHIPGMQPGSPGIQTHIPGMQPGSPGIQTHIPGMQPGSPGIQTHIPGMQPGSPGIQTHIPGMQPGSPGIQTHIPGMQPGSPGIQTHIPGMQPGSPGIQTHIPGMQPGSPGIQTHIPGMQPGSPGIQTHIPGMQPGSPGIQTHIPGMQPGSPGIQTHIPGMQPGSPGIQTHIPGMQPGSPGIQTHIPGMQPGSPGIQTHIPGMQPGSPGIQTHIPGMQPGSPGIQTHIPGMQPGSPGIQTHIPGMQPGSPGIQTHIPGMQPGSPGIQTHIPGMQPGSPGIQTHIPGMQPGSPGIQTHIPGMHTGSPGIQTHIPEMHTGSPGIQTHIPGMHTGSPGIKTHIPGMHTGSPGIETYAPGMQPGSPGTSPLQEWAVPVGTPGSSGVPRDERSVSFGGQVSSRDGQASNLQDEKGKIRQLKDAFGILGAPGADWEVDGSAQTTLPPG
ncbi:PREDICTED: collagen alpha-1(VII) chain-like [Calidris pugnax]|uniref:collagen alpha-1(VII) chain-like n=1 Tax=Calidris pugnax TaxID=198806 RepID=UPI00071E47B2|nr:PREDICTED: collagen alpha-1(VII) chain-like [Calidris pugnax]